MRLGASAAPSDLEKLEGPWKALILYLVNNGSLETLALISLKARAAAAMGKVNWMMRGKAKQGNRKVFPFHQAPFYLGCSQKVPLAPVGLSTSVKVAGTVLQQKLPIYVLLICVINIKTNHHNPPSVN